LGINMSASTASSKSVLLFFQYLKRLTCIVQISDFFWLLRGGSAINRGIKFHLPDHGSETV
jgi:hypothetical protein